MFLFPPYKIFYSFIETLSTNSAITVEVLAAKEETREKDNVWHQNVLQEVAIWAHGEIAVWGKVWTSWQQEQVSVKI